MNNQPTTENQTCLSCGGIKSRDRKCWCWSAPITSKEEAYALSRRILQRETSSAFSFDDGRPTFRGRKPDLYLPGYLSRWWLIPRNRWFNIYLHRFEGSDDERAIHDHPWYSVSFLLKGEMIEHSFKGVRHIPWLLPIFRTAKFAHRLELVKGPVWTVFITGPKIREWGFFTKKGWMRHEEYARSFADE